MQYKIFVQAVIWHNNKILLAKKRIDILHPVAGAWHFPGGQIKEMEHPQQAVIREVKEELDLQIEPLRVIDFKVRRIDFPQNKEKSGHKLFIYFEAIPVGKTKFKIEKTELSQAKWVNLKEIDKYLKKEYFDGGVRKFVNCFKKDDWKVARVVDCFIINKGKVAIFKRTEKVGVYKNYWGTIAGYIQSDNQPIEQAYIELKEEGGLDKNKLKLISKTGPRIGVDNKIRRIWIVYAFLFKVRNRKVKLDWEHSQIKWIEPGLFKKYKHVPHMPEILFELLRK